MSEIQQLQFGGGKVTPHPVTVVKIPLNRSLKSITESKSNLFSITSSQQNRDGIALFQIQHSADALVLCFQALTEQRCLPMLLMLL